LREVRALLRAMRAEDAPIDLGGDLADLARDFSAAGSAITVDVRDPDAVPAGARRALSLIAAEAVHNAVRHAGADGIRIALIPDGDAVELVVADDGVGFDRAEGGGVGLATMRERALEIGAVFRIDSARGAGTTVRVRLPVARPAIEIEEVPA
jgi:signal transduction histidine kinase